jgi:hypothetical protein
MIDKLKIASDNWAENDVDVSYIVSLVKDIYKAGFKRGVERCKEMKNFTPDEIEMILIEYGQNDRQFKLGETIKYSPSDVRRILEGQIHED